MLPWVLFNWLMASPVCHRQWFCRSCHPNTNPHSLPHLSSEAMLPSSVRQPSDCAPRKHVRTHSLEEAQTLKRDSNNWHSLQRYKTQSHRSETIYLPFFFFLSKVDFKSCKLNQFLHCHSNQDIRRLYPQSKEWQNPFMPQPLWAPFVFLRLPEVQTLLTPQFPCASISIAHLTHVGLTPQLRPTEQHRR